MILNEETFAIEDSPPLELAVPTPTRTDGNDTGIQAILMTQIQQLYTVVDSYNSGIVTCEQLGYVDIANAFKKYSQDILNEIGYLNALVSSLQPTVQILTNPLTGNELTMI